MPHIYRVVLSSSYEAQLIQNVFWIRHPTDTNGDKAIEVASNAVTTLTGALRQCHNSNWCMVDVTVLCMTMPEGQGSSFFQNFTTNRCGIIAGNRQAPHVAICLTLHGAGSHPLGHLYFAGVSNVDIADGALLDSGFNRYVNAANSLLSAWGSSTPASSFKFGVWSKKLAGPHKPHSFSAWSNVQSIFVNRFVTSMRTRRAGVGR